MLAGAHRYGARFFAFTPPVGWGLGDVLMGAFTL